MKLNWGTSIAIFYSCFVVAMVFMVFRSTQNKMDLVQENYYAKDLAYESFRQKRQNSDELKETVAIKYSIADKAIQVHFPEGMKTATGEIFLFRPSNKSMDTKIKLKVDESGQMSIPVEQKFKPGLWRVQLDWEANGQQYFKEESIVI
jgi:hypothetical protein